MKEKSDGLFFMLLLYLLLFCKADECQKEVPIKFENNCEIRFCSQFQLENEICIISNEKVKKQWLNNILQNKEKSLGSLRIISSDQGILLVSYDIDNNLLLMYNLNNNNNQLILNEIGTSNYNIDLTALLNEKFSININNKSEKYLLACILESCELLNYNNDRVLSFDMFNEHDSNLFTLKNSFFKLNDNNYFYGVIRSIYDDEHLMMTKFSISFNGESYVLINQNKNLDDYSLKDQDILSCFQTSNNFIECLIIDSNSYLKVFIFDEFLEYKHDFHIDNSVSLSKCIHLEK